MADQETTFRLRFENEDMERVFTQMANRIEDTDDRLRKLEKTQKETFDASAKAARAANDQLKQQTANLDANSVRFKSLGDAGKSALNEIESSGNTAVSTLARLARTAGPVGTVIAAVGGAIAAAFLDVEKNAKKVKREMEGLKAIGNELKDRTFAGIRAITNLWAGDLAAAAIEAAKVRNGVNGTFREVDAAAKRAEDLREELKTANREFVRSEARRAAELQKLQTLASDGNRTIEERINLVRSAAAAERDLNQIQISRLSKQLEIISNENAALGESEERRNQLAELEADLIELRGVSTLIAIQTQQQVNALLQEEAEARQRIIDQLREFNALITDQGAELAIIKQIQNFEELRDAVGAAGLADEYAGELAELDRVISGLNQRLVDGLVKPLEQLPDTLNDALQVTSITADPLSESLAEAGIEAAERLAKGFKDKYEELTDDQRKFIEDQFSDIFESVADIIVSNTVIAINQQQEVIDAREDAITELERQLSDEEDLAEKGVANNASRLRQSLQEERTILRREQQRRLDLEKRAARQRLITNSIQQASEITLATAKLLKEGASGFIPGLIAAAGGIALLFRIIAQSKANAAAFSQPPQFREGTAWLSGPNHEGGGVTIEAEGGERIFSKKLNEMVGGSQVSNEELIDFALRGMNADSAIGPLARSVASGAAARQEIERFEAWERNKDMIDAIRQAGAETNKELEAIIRTIKERPNYHPLDQVGILEYYKGNTRYIEKIIPKGGKD